MGSPIVVVSAADGCLLPSLSVANFRKYQEVALSVCLCSRTGGARPNSLRPPLAVDGVDGRANLGPHRHGRCVAIAADLGFPALHVQEVQSSMDKSHDLVKVLRELTVMQRNIANLQLELQERKKVDQSSMDKSVDLVKVLRDLTVMQRNIANLQLYLQRRKMEFLICASKLCMDGLFMID